MDYDSPSLIIRYKTPPDSPIEVHYSYDEDESGPIITPKRKSRTTGSKRPYKRQSRKKSDRRKEVNEAVEMDNQAMKQSSSDGSRDIQPVGQAEHIFQVEVVENQESEHSRSDGPRDIEVAAVDDVNAFPTAVDDGNDWNLYEDNMELEALETRDGDDEFSEFVAAVLSGECAMYQLTQRLYVVNGWNRRKQQATVSQ